MTLSPTAERALAAYGGHERWLAATAVEATLSVSGLAFLMKRQHPFSALRVRAEIARPYSRLQPIDRHGHIGVLEGQAVRLEDEAGNVLETRDDPRSKFPYGRRTFYWDALDQTYFSGYASWNYLTLPALLLRDDIAWTEVADGALEARFPPELPTHCPVQRFLFDTSSGLLRQHDYTAEPFGGWARAAHVILAHDSWEGIHYPSRRRVTPRGPGGRPLPGPTLIAIEVRDWQLV